MERSPHYRSTFRLQTNNWKAQATQFGTSIRSLFKLPTRRILIIILHTFCALDFAVRKGQFRIA